MKNETNCPKCHSENIYADGNLWICPECSNEWTAKVDSAVSEVVDDGSIKDSNGALLTDGDTVSVLKELKVKGSTAAIKVGTKVKNIRLIDEVDGHNISCRIDGIGVIYLKSEFVRKA
jgi:protein PhnA